MFNLVKYRYRFLIASLIVIVPGIVSLLLFGLNVGIDFRGGTNVELRPQTAVTQDQATQFLKSFNLDPQIVMGNDTSLKAGAWITTQGTLDATTQKAAKQTLSNFYTGQTLTYDISTIQMHGKNATLLFVTGFSKTPNAGDIENVLKKISSASSSTSTTATPTATATATPTVSATATATAKNTSTVTPKVTTTATPKTITIQNIAIGANTKTINILTLTSVSRSSGDGGKISLADIQTAFLQNGGPYFQVVTTDEVSGTVAGTTTLMSFLAVTAASVFILLYVWFSFRKVPKAWRYGACAIIALLHDVLVVLGIFSILGKFADMQINALFITGLLTVIGFSVHDTIVVFDRIRENMQRRGGETFDEVVNISLVQTMARSLNTSLTVLFTLLTLFLFTAVSPDVHTFTLTLLIGIFSGTYSSIFNASMMLVIWEKGEMGLGRFDKTKKVTSTRREREAHELAHSRG